MGSGMGPVWRHMRTDRSAAAQKVSRETVRRVFGFATPHRPSIALFLVLTVFDAALVVVTPLLVKKIVDDGILQQDTEPPSRSGWDGCRPGSGRA
jgi:ATP-binding cassette subfamily B protein